MPFVISDDCTTCGACADSCPVDAIVEGEEKYKITDECIECGSCVDTCPIEAIKEG